MKQNDWVCLLSHVQLFVTPWRVACQVPLSMGILQARILECVTFPVSRGSSQPRDQTQVSLIAGRFFTAEPPGKPKNIGVGGLSFPQGIFPTQESNRGLLHWRLLLYQLSYQGSQFPVSVVWTIVHYWNPSPLSKCRAHPSTQNVPLCSFPVSYRPTLMTLKATTVWLLSSQMSFACSRVSIKWTLPGCVTCVHDSVTQHFWDAFT